MTSQSVVVVEDDPITQELICSALETQLSLSVYSFTHSKLAREFLLKQNDNSVSLIISDQMMPDYDGLSLLKLWRERGMHTPFLLLTADASRDTVVKARNAGVSGYVAKPFEVSALLKLVTKLLCA